MDVHLELKVVLEKGAKTSGLTLPPFEMTAKNLNVRHRA